MIGKRKSSTRETAARKTKRRGQAAPSRGTAGKAAQVKALVNMVMNINTAGLAEGLGLGNALGLDLSMLREVFSQTGANSRVLQTDGEDMQNRDHSCFFSAAHAAKDSGIAFKLGKEQGLDLPLAAATKKQYDRMVKEGFGELDKSGIAELTFKGRGKTA
jgi:3-hydroxyisobutyrate dehydrogenase-like beta-hydroxyacid dehydrogenase